MKVNCLNGFNIDKFRESIELYETENEQTPYAFMSNDTGNLLEHECEARWRIFSPERGTLSALLTKGMIASFEGVKIYPNDDLPLGVVELR